MKSQDTFEMLILRSSKIGLVYMKVLVPDNGTVPG